STGVVIFDLTLFRRDLHSFPTRRSSDLGESLSGSRGLFGHVGGSSDSAGGVCAPRFRVDSGTCSEAVLSTAHRSTPNSHREHPSSLHKRNGSGGEMVRLPPLVSDGCPGCSTAYSTGL